VSSGESEMHTYTLVFAYRPSLRPSLWKAAIVLSASVTFLSLPGLDNIARIVALVAILCATASMVSSVIALFAFKAEMERTVSTLGGEGLMNLSVCLLLSWQCFH
jgi:TRAP-type uncharacterized transport system fused permease subunit